MPEGNKKFLVTGGAGFIGSHLADKLVEQGHGVVVVDNLSAGKEEYINPKAKFYKENIQSPEMNNIFQKEKPDGVFHLAAIPRVPVSIEDPVGTADANVVGTANVFKAAADSGVKRVVFASSSSVYGNDNEIPFREESEPKPESPYAAHKLTGEHFARLFTNLHNLPVVSLRYFNVYGPRIDFNSDYSLVLGKFMRFKRDGQPFTIHGDGEQTRGFSYIDDVVDANIKAMTSEKLKGGEVINIGTEKGSSINELADLLGGEKEYLPPRPGDVLHTAADTTRARELLGWEQKVGFEEGVQKTMEWFSELK